MSAAPVKGKTHILVIEDNPADVDLLRRAFASAGLDCQLTLIDDGADALALFRRHGKFTDAAVPDLAIIDLNLPKHGGIEILEAMRANQAFDAVLVVVLSSSSSPREREKVERFRIGRFIMKPADLEEFLRIGRQVKELLAENGKRELSSGG